jgi:hypothetical protein
LSVNLSNSLLTTVTWTANYATTADTFGTLASPTVTQIATGTFTVTSTLTNYSAQISIPAAATTGIEIVFTVGAQTSGTWVIGNVQLEKSSIATSFDYRPYGTELALCQRYFESSMTVAPADNMSVASTGVYAMSTSGATPVITYSFKVTKRSDPTLTYYAPATTSPSGKVREDATGTIRNVTGGGTTNWGAIIGVTSGAATVSYQFGYHASAEL